MTPASQPLRRERGCNGTMTRQVLQALTEPARPSQIAAELGVTYATARDTMKALSVNGWLDRPVRGVYVRNAAGDDALTREDPKVRHLRATHKPVPEGKGWTPERTAWLDAHYARLGHQTCAELLGMHAKNVHAYATSRGLRFGDLPGYQLVSEVAALLGRDYTVIYNRAQNAGVLTFPGTTKGRQVRRKALVPDRWVEQIAQEIQPPTPDDVPVLTLGAQLGLSRSQIHRVTRAVAYLRTPRGPEQQARLYVSRADADALIATRRAAPPLPPVTTATRERLLRALEAAGANGLTERELYTALNVSRAIIRARLTQLQDAGTVTRHRAGTTLDPLVFRLAVHVQAPEPQQRHITLPGRPRKH